METIEEKRANWEKIRKIAKGPCECYSANPFPCTSCYAKETLEMAGKTLDSIEIYEDIDL